MMKTLYLMRHGDAEFGAGMDKERMLTEAGMRNVRRQGETVFKEDRPEKYYVSTAIRTRQSMQHLMESLSIDESLVSYEESMYNASVRELFDLIVQSDESCNRLCLIGHNPSISYLAEYLTGEEIGSISPAGVVKMFIDASWSEITQSGASLDFYLGAE